MAQGMGFMFGGQPGMGMVGQGQPGMGMVGQGQPGMGMVGQGYPGMEMPVVAQGVPCFAGYGQYGSGQGKVSTVNSQGNYNVEGFPRSRSFLPGPYGVSQSVGGW